MLVATVSEECVDEEVVMVVMVVVMVMMVMMVMVVMIIIKIIYIIIIIIIMMVIMILAQANRGCSYGLSFLLATISFLATEVSHHHHPSS